jgi:hypothetical protein
MKLNDIRVNGFDGSQVAILLHSSQLSGGQCNHDFLQFVAASHQLVKALENTNCMKLVHHK